MTAAVMARTADTDTILLSQLVKMVRRRLAATAAK
jgi:hypothetical protein